MNAFLDVDAVMAPAAFGWVLLQLHYDGRRPPIALLDDIARLGWSVPPPPARPASAIDWYTPNPLTGERFTVNQWTAVHDIDPPGRNLARAAWNAGNRAVALRALAPVLHGHHVRVSSPVPELAGLLSGPATAPAAPGAPTDHGPVVVSFTAPIEGSEGVERFLQSTGLAYWSASEIRTRRQVFRGSVSEIDVRVLVGEVVVRGDQAGALADHLRGEQASVQSRPAVVDDFERVDGARAAGTDPAGPPGPVSPVAPASLRVDLGMAAGDAVERLVHHPALEGLAVEAGTGTRKETVVFRGSATEVARPCLYVEVGCPADRLTLVRAVLAREAGVPPDQVERLR
jgi:hypothetical protein